jgi:PatG C-terminal
MRESLTAFLNRVYHDLHNLGQTSRDRALNFQATNIFQATSVCADAIASGIKASTAEFTVIAGMCCLSLIPKKAAIASGILIYLGCSSQPACHHRQHQTPVHSLANPTGLYNNPNNNPK